VLVPDFLGFVLFFIAIGGIVTVVLGAAGWNGWKNYKGDF
jgi:hypothetical protein